MNITVTDHTKETEKWTLDMTRNESGSLVATLCVAVLPPQIYSLFVMGLRCAPDRERTYELINKVFDPKKFPVELRESIEMVRMLSLKNAELKIWEDEEPQQENRVRTE
jgi:hypothetical protein